MYGMMLVYKQRGALLKNIKQLKINVRYQRAIAFGFVSGYDKNEGYVRS